MNIIDSSGWLEYFADAKDADFDGLPDVRFVPK